MSKTVRTAAYYRRLAEAFSATSYAQHLMDDQLRHQKFLQQNEKQIDSILKEIETESRKGAIRLFLDENHPLRTNPLLRSYFVNIGFDFTENPHAVEWWNPNDRELK